jgi:hypothetical protein
MAQAFTTVKNLKNIKGKTLLQKKYINFKITDTFLEFQLIILTSQGFNII